MKNRLGSKLHASWLIAWASAGLLVGVAASASLHQPIFSELFWPGLSAALLLIALVGHFKWMIVLAIFAGLMFGVWRGSLERRALDSYGPYYGQTVSLKGKISQDASYGPHGDQRLMLKNILVNGRPLHGQIWASTIGTHADLRRSDEVTLLGKLGTGFGNLPASMFNARLASVIRPRPGDVALNVRDWFSGGIRKAIPEPEAALGVGYLVGQRRSLPASLDGQLKMVGLTHAVVASGYNLTILVGFARGLFLGLSKYLATLSAAAMIGGFMMITGLSPSMTRAGLVTGLSLVAWYYGRRLHPLVLLPFAAAITVIINPAYVWGDVGWALSFAAFTGVILLAPLIHHYFFGDDKKPGVIRQTLVSTMAAQLATMPIMIFAFGHYSPYALLANLLVLPLIPLTMLLTFLAGAGGLALPGLAHIFGWPATLVLGYMVHAVNYVANLPGAEGSLSFSAAAVAASYASLVLIGLFIWQRTAHNFRQDNQILIGEEV